MTNTQKNLTNKIKQAGLKMARDSRSLASQLTINPKDIKYQPIKIKTVCKHSLWLLIGFGILLYLLINKLILSILLTIITYLSGKKKI